MRKKKERGGLENKKQKQNLNKDTRYARYLASMEPREDPASSANLREVQSEDMMNMKRG